MELNDKFDLRIDSRQWILTHKYMGKATKGKDASEQTKQTYHGDLEQVANHILHTTGVRCKAVEELAECFKRESKRMVEMINGGLCAENAELKATVKELEAAHDT